MSNARPLSRDDRQDTRNICIIPGRVLCGHRSEPVTIVNLSNYGAGLLGQALPDEGEQVVLASDHMHVSGFVMWKHGVKCGLLLNEAIDPLDIILKSVVVAS